MAEPFEQVFLPMSIGGTVLAALSWFVAFVVCYYSFEWWRTHRKTVSRASKLLKSRKKPANDGPRSKESCHNDKT